MSKSKGTRRALLGASALVGAMALYATGAAAADAPAYQFNQPQQPLAAALRAYSAAADQEIIFADNLVRGRTAPRLEGAYTAQQALDLLLAGTGLSVSRTPTGVLRLEAAQSPQGGSAGNAVQALIVTAQKREEDIQDVPIAISAFSQEDLTRSQIAGGPDLITQVPNMTFTKTNFTGYSIQIRGIGTQAISATTDPAVAVAFNNTPFIRNRFFEQEFYDLQRVEVLRGPQGTLYGRNATAGVVNLISAKPKFTYEAKIAADVANYDSTRLEGMVNVPLVEDVVALRLAGAWTKREGYAFNEITQSPIDGRDLWSTRLSLRFAPTDAIDVNLIWEHFQEDDDRIRSGKQLCKRHMPETIGGRTVPYGSPAPGSNNGMLYETYFSQGCEAASLYSPDSFEAPVGLRLPYYRALEQHSLPVILIRDGVPFDPYLNKTQSSDLRVIESTVDPKYSAKTDIAELQASFDISGNLTLTSETAYLADTVFSLQDYNRFNTASGAFDAAGNPGLVTAGVLTADGFFCDPQIGCADRVVVVDVSTAKSRQFSQELRLASDYDGPFNFSLGANFLRYDTEDKYYVFINTLTLAAAARAVNWTNVSTYTPNVTDFRACLPEGFRPPNVDGAEDIQECVYIDPNPIGALNDMGHNYFLSKNPYKLISYAVFGEAYYNVTENLKITAGLRWTVDKKEAPRIPSWTFAANSAGYPVAEVIEQEWNEPTGRLTIDWKPDLAFTDETLLYGSYAHGYKAGGANPPAAGVVMRGVAASSLVSDFELIAQQQAAIAPRKFEAEFVDAFEIGAKNTLLDGALTVNLAAFYYDYTGYQISQIVNRSAINTNFDAEVWGLEVEADWRPLENLRLGFKGGYENTRMADGSRAIDTMDRTNGNPDWYVTGPFPTFPSNCIMPTYTVVRPDGTLAVHGGPSGGLLGACELAYVMGGDPFDSAPYTYAGYPGFDADDYPEINAGAGFYKDLSGNELPNAPHFTATITADYTLPLSNEWLVTLHTDLYYQSEAWTRIFNTEGYDKLKAYSNINLAAIFANDEAGWRVMAYVKNVLDRDSITGAFLNSDDTGLTTNVFLTEPRLYGIRVTKDFDGGPWRTGGSLDHNGPFPLTLELGGQAQRHDAPYEAMAPGSFAPLSAALDTTGSIQNRDLDWGDGRSAKLTYQQAGSPWSVSASVRYGRTNSDTARLHTQYDQVIHACSHTGTLGSIFCTPSSTKYNPLNANYTAELWSDVAARNSEEHSITEFAVGRDFGLGGLLPEGKVSLGIRYAAFESDSALEGYARADWLVATNWYNAGVGATDYRARLAAKREFKGTGPIVSWEAAVRLLGDEQTGHLNLDWSVSAGVLFGDQDTSIDGDGLIRAAKGFPFRSSLHNDNNWPMPTVGTPTAFDEDRVRSDSVTVPLADVSLGLSYEVGRINIGAGYRWERYFDVLDAGYDEHQDADRTIDGPYFKLAIGFGG